MNPRSDRWKLNASGLLVPGDLGIDSEERLDETILHLPCFEPSGLRIDCSLREILQHLLIVGNSGAGKSTILNQLWWDLINFKSATGQRVGLLILDSQGDHTVDNVRYLATQAGRAEDVIVLSPEEGLYNPLSELTSFAAVDSVASKIISATKFSSHGAGDTRDAYWTESVLNLVQAGLTYLLIHQEKPTVTDGLQFLSNLFLQPECPAETQEMIDRADEIIAAAEHLSAGIRVKLELVRNTIGSFRKMDPRTRSIVQSGLNITLAPFLAATALPYWDCTKGTPVNPAVALDGKIVVVSTRAATEVETSALICRLVKMDFYAAAQTRQSLGKSPIAGILMDEFHYSVTTGSPRWSDISNLATLRGKGVFVVAALQGLIQIDLQLGTAATEALLINFSNLILMRSVEVGHLYNFAHRILGYKTPRMMQSASFRDSGDILVPEPSTGVPLVPVCPPGSLAQLQSHQAYIKLANGFRTEEPVWLAPLFLVEPPGIPKQDGDDDLAALRRAEFALSNEDPEGAGEPTFYSQVLWEFVVNAAPRQVEALKLMTFDEFVTVLKKLGHKPNGIETIPAGWRTPCLRLARRLPKLTRLVHLSQEDGCPKVAIIAWSGCELSINQIQKIEARWKHSLYPSRLRPLHAYDRKWLEKYYPHLCGQIISTDENKPSLS